MGSSVTSGERIRASLLGLAVGDALGWPQEQNSKNIDRSAPTPELKFRAWRRRSGGRFQPFDEEIGPGEYSDDTQLTLCVCRSLLHGSDWHDFFTAVELPAWAAYERGGGRSVLKAASSWASGRPPWDNEKADPVAYFGTGANGVAMRALPHVVWGLESGDFAEVRRRVVLDGCATHGHATAMVGALMHASVLSSALRLEGTLGYGELLDALADRHEDWSDNTALDFPSGWRNARERMRGEGFEDEWAHSVDEAHKLLSVARDAMKSGPLAADEDTLKTLGVFNRKVNGSGIVSAVAAAFVASRSASSPELGLLDIAFLQSADADTLASMSASILGAIAGLEWMNGLRRMVQDHDYIQRMADALGSKQPLATFAASPERVTKSRLDRWSKSLAEVGNGSATELPDGRIATVEAVEQLPNKSDKQLTSRYVLRAEDGQTLFVVKHSRRKQQEPQRDATAVTHVGLRVRVSSLSVARDFYERILGFVPSKATEAFVRYGDAFALEADSGKASAGLPFSAPPFVIHVESADVAAMYRAVKSAGTRIIDRLRVERGRERFSCVDPDGNTVEIVAPTNK